jgi:hypothetical protein
LLLFGFVLKCFCIDYFWLAMEINFTLLKHKATPIYQFILALVVGLSGMFICRFVHVEPGTEYFAAMVGIILYSILNTVISVAYSSFLRYTMPSFYIYIALVAVLFLSAKMFSGISIWTLPIYRNMVTSVSLFYLIIGILVRALRLIYEAAENDL